MPEQRDADRLKHGPFAHTKSGRPPREWEPLEAHLMEVSRLAGTFAGVFGATELAALAGKWHDLGKHASAFQRYLELSEAGAGPGRGPDHSTAGALHAVRSIPGPLGQCVAFLIAGHHAGLANLGTPEDSDGSCLMRRLADPPDEAIDAIRRASEEIKAAAAPSLPGWLTSAGGAPLRLSLFVRMVFSCLIDADRLATEAFGAPELASNRLASVGPSIPDLQRELDLHIDRLSQQAAAIHSPVAAARASLLADCRQKAQEPPGLFSLTAPTGSGKTLSSMSFALRHAAKHGLRRVVYALPFTSVTEQNAGVFRDVFRRLGPSTVLEHHSAYAPPGGGGTEEDHPERVWHRLMVENWDAPVVVTTNVQLLESLFASGASDCRKLHRIARSVIVLDEAQSLPAQMLKPTLAALRELASSYGCTIVLCSATMPAVIHRADFPIGLSPVREIVSDTDALERSMRRVAVTRVPVHTLGGVVCFGRVNASTAALALCAESGVAVSFCSRAGRLLARSSGFTPGNVLLRREQYRAADNAEDSLRIAGAMVAAKIANARTTLMRAARDHGDSGGGLERASVRMASAVESAMTAPTADELRGIEGEAAAEYFAVFDSLVTLPAADREAFKMSGRSRRPPMDRMNAVLSFLYAMLTHDARTACESVGLDPAVGFLHADRPGRPSLALDLIEELRSFLCDRLAISLVNRRQLAANDFECQSSGGLRLSEAARKAVVIAYQKRKQEELVHPYLQERVSIGLIVHLQARLLSRVVRGELDVYPAFVWK